MSYQEDLTPFFDSTYGFGDYVQWVSPTSSGYVLAIFDKAGANLDLQNGSVETSSPVLHVPAVNVPGVNNTWNFIIPSGSTNIYYVCDVQADITNTVYDLTLSEDHHK